MAQSRLRDWKDPLGSFEHNIFNLGLHGEGRYMGFDTLVPEGVGSLVFALRHTNSGMSYKNQVNSIIGPLGMYMTPQGVLIQETDEIGPLTINTNQANSSDRYDIVYAQHDYITTTGGQDATYGIFQGPIGNPIKPILPDPLKQVTLGIIKIPAGATQISDCTYYKAKCPDSGDGEDARLTTPNIYKALNAFNESAIVYTTNQHSFLSGSNLALLWSLKNDGNSFNILPTTDKTLDGLRIEDIEYQSGMRVWLIVNEFVTLRESRYFLSSPYAGLGYRAFVIPPTLGNIDVSNNGGGSNMGLKPSAGETWELEFVYHLGKFWLVRIGGVGVKTNGAFVRGQILEWWGDVANNFDDQGTGINLMGGWALCNGNNNTPNLRGKLTAMPTSVNAAGQDNISTEADAVAAGLNPNNYVFGEQGQTLGSRGTMLNVPQLPKYRLPFVDHPHLHDIDIPSRDFKNDGDSGQDFGFYGSSHVPLQTKAATVDIEVWTKLPEDNSPQAAVPIIPPVMLLVKIMKL